MSDNLPLPSTQAATDTAPPRMRLLYPLAAVCVAIVFLSPTSGEAQTGGAVKLRADQQRLVELTLQNVEPAMRPLMRDTLARNFAPYDEAQIAMMIAAVMAEAGNSAPADDAPVVEAEGTLSPEDFEFNRAQYEPVIRKHHAVQKRYDEFVDARVAQYCPGRDQYARFGSGWRYDQGQFTEPSSLATWNVDANVQVAGGAYAPQDGRYKFDFSKVKMTFDEKAVDAAIQMACEQVHAAGRDFLAKLDPVIARQDWDAAYKLEQWAHGRIGPIRNEMQAKLEKASPGDFTAIQMALMNGRKVK